MKENTKNFSYNLAYSENRNVRILKLESVFIYIFVTRVIYILGGIVWKFLEEKQAMLSFSM